jgi:hypothetical protein
MALSAKMAVKAELLGVTTDIVENLEAGAYEKTMMVGVYTGAEGTCDPLIGTYKFTSILNGRSCYRKVSGLDTHDVRLYWSKNNWRLDAGLYGGDMETLAYGPSMSTSPVDVVEWHVMGTPIDFKIIHVVNALALEVDRLKAELSCRVENDEATEPTSEQEVADDDYEVEAAPSTDENLGASSSASAVPPSVVPPRFPVAPSVARMKPGFPIHVAAARHVPVVVPARFQAAPTPKRQRLRGGAAIHAKHIVDMLQAGATPAEVSDYVEALQERKDKRRPE